MEEPKPAEQSATVQYDPAIDVGANFLQALFSERDMILFRPIETWDEEGKKRSRVDYRNTYYRQAMPALVKVTLLQLLRLSEKERLNLFFGVCPRCNNGGRFDLAWQIRTVRVLWTDIDHIAVEEAVARVEKAGLPPASIVVNSGNGVHIYWLLAEPYLIDDAGDPLPVETEWTKTADGRKKPRKYIVENGDKVYLDLRQHVSRLSPKAQHIQDVLAGIAKALGGDHTTDLSRLLRVPGSFNRKGQRNGKEPVPTALIECDATRKYPLAVFESLKSASPETERAKQIALMPLPQPRKVSLSKADKLAELIAACGIATAGSRSEADFAVCCYAIRNGVPKEDVWAQVQGVGKFAEQGRRYFDVTWANAEYDVRVIVFDKLQSRAASISQPTQDPAADVCEDETGDPNVAGNQGGGTGRPVIRVNPAVMPVGDTLHKVTNRLLSVGNCFSRAEQLVVINDQQISPILSPPELAGLLNQHVEFFFENEEGGEYKPFPPAYSNTWLNHHVERSRLPAIKLFTRNPVYTEDWRLVAPGFDAPSGIYYAGPAVSPLADTTHLDLSPEGTLFETMRAFFAVVNLT